MNVNFKDIVINYVKENTLNIKKIFGKFFNLAENFYTNRLLIEDSLVFFFNEN